MMVERVPYTGDMGRIMKNLDEATQIMTHLGKTKENISDNELIKLADLLHEVNHSISSRLVGTYSLIPAVMSEKLEKALRALQLFKLNTQTDRNLAVQQNVAQVILSLFRRFSREEKKLRDNLRNLKDLKDPRNRLGHKIEQSNKSDL